MSLDVAYSLMLSETFSIAAGVRWIYSDLTFDFKEDTQPGSAFAADIAAYYQNYINLGQRECQLGLGLNISNIGSKINFGGDNHSFFIPTNLRLGASLKVPIDEYNRIPTRTQSALLEVMEESAVTVDGVTRPLPQPFTVMATENPVGSVGTQMLPESQLDRFMVCVVMGYPDAEAEMEILARQPRHALLDRVQPVMDKNDLLAMQQQVDEVFMSDEIRRYIVELSRATRQDGRLALGLSPRASLAVAGMARAAAYLSGRNYVAPQDVTAIFADVTHHRLRLTEQARTGGETVENIIADVLHTTPRPRPEKPSHGR